MWRHGRYTAKLGLKSPPGTSQGLKPIGQRSTGDNSPANSTFGVYTYMTLYKRVFGPCSSRVSLRRWTERIPLI